MGDSTVINHLESCNNKFPVSSAHLSRSGVFPHHGKQPGHDVVYVAIERWEGHAEEGEETVEGVSEELGVTGGGEGDGEEGEERVHHL